MYSDICYVNVHIDFIYYELVCVFVEYVLNICHRHVIKICL